MKKIGFIDYYLDEWHANYYPEFFRSEAGDRMEVAYAYGKIDAPNGMTNKEWSEKYDAELLGSIEEVIENTYKRSKNKDQHRIDFITNKYCPFFIKIDQYQHIICKIRIS